LGITVDNTPSWTQHIDTIIPKYKLIQIFPKFITCCTRNGVLCFFFHSVMSYGLIFGGNSTNSKCVFKLQKRASRIIMGAKNNNSCREFFKLLKILPLSGQYIDSLLMFEVNNRNLFLDNADLYSIKTRNSYNLHPPLSHLTKYQNGVHYARIRVSIHLPTSIKSTANETKVFKKTSKRFLMDNSFYSMDEFLILRNNVYSRLQQLNP